MEKPSEAQIKQLKEKYADRALHLVELKNEGDDEMYYVVMKGANDDEYKIFVDATFDAREKAKNDIDRNERMAQVERNTIVMLTVWPEREELKKMLFDHPGFADKIAHEIPKHAGSSAEVRSKKL